LRERVTTEDVVINRVAQTVNKPVFHHLPRAGDKRKKRGYSRR